MLFCVYGIAGKKMPDGLQLSALKRKHIAGQFTRKGVTVKFNIKIGAKRRVFELLDKSNKALIRDVYVDTKYRRKILGGLLQISGDIPSKILKKIKLPVNPVLKGDPKAIKKLIAKSEYKILPYLSRALGAKGVSGLKYPISLPLHYIALASAKAHKIKLASKKPSTLRLKRKKGKSPKKSSKQCYDQRGDPCHDDCFGMCGETCTCWKWVCQDCCINQGCLKHDKWCSEYECNGGAVAGAQCYAGPMGIIGAGPLAIGAAHLWGCRYQDKPCTDGRVCITDNGIGGYDLKSSSDRSLAFDYNSNGKSDHMILYRPGTGKIWILKNTKGVFSPVYKSNNGIGGYDLKSYSDKIFAYDYNHNGKADHLVMYRPGHNVVWILKNVNGTFSAVYKSTNGIGGYSLSSSSDLGLAFDYEHSGKLDYMVFFRPGTGIINIIKNVNGTFSSVYKSTNGIGGYDLKSTRDRITAFDYTHSGKLDYLVMYRPGNGVVWILQNKNGSFSNVYNSTHGIGGYDLKSTNDKIIAYDYTHSGKLDYLTLYRPGNNIIWILQNKSGSFSNVFNSKTGIGGYSLTSTADLVYAFDYGHTGKFDYFVLYRPGVGLIWIEAHTAKLSFVPVYTSKGY